MRRDIKPCCSTWDNNELLIETSFVRAVLDGYPVVPGHALVYPKRHVESFYDLSGEEIVSMLVAIKYVMSNSDADDHTIGINDGPLAGRTVHHLHVHVFPRRAGDVDDPRGGVRRLLIPDTNDDLWIRREED